MKIKLSPKGLLLVPTPAARATVSPTATVSPPAVHTSAGSAAPPVSVTQTAAPTGGGDVPTAVPAGSGSRAAPSDIDRIGLEIGLGAAGAALIGIGGLAMKRRARHRH